MLLLLFDVDGTLSRPRNKIDHDMLMFLHNIKKSVKLGIVSGSDLSKLEDQIGPDILNFFDYVFSENGVVAYHKGSCFHSNSLVKHLGEDYYQQLVNQFLLILSETHLPIKRGNFLELRTGMLNVCPIGRSCSQQERDEFEQYDKEHHVRETIVEKIYQSFSHDLRFKASIGGQISIDVFPIGWDKTYCLQHLEDIDEIHFFGDRIQVGGNDYEIANDNRVIAHSVTDPQDTRKQVEKLLTEN